MLFKKTNYPLSAPKIKFENYAQIPDLDFRKKEFNKTFSIQALIIKS